MRNSQADPRNDALPCTREMNSLLGVGPHVQSPGLPKAYRPSTAAPLSERRTFGDMSISTSPPFGGGNVIRAFDSRPVSCRVQSSVVSLPKEMRNVLR
jgi:hypothetical protein